jgi:hypothetical protein
METVGQHVVIIVTKECKFDSFLHPFQHHNSGVASNNWVLAFACVHLALVLYILTCPPSHLFLLVLLNLFSLLHQATIVLKEKDV